MHSVLTVLTRAAGFFICCRNRGFEILHPLLENVGIRNLCVSRAVNTSSDYSSSYHHRAVNFLTVSMKNARWRAEHRFMFLLNGVQC